MIIQEVIELDHKVIDSDPNSLKNAIDTLKARIMRMCEQHITVEVDSRIKNGNAVKRIIVTFEP